MADALVGNIVANLRVDATAWQQGLQQAAQQLAQFEQTIARLTGQLNQFSQAFQQAFTQNQQGLAAIPQRAQQASQSFQQFNTQVNQTNQAFTVINQTVQQFNTHLNTTTTNVNNVRQGLQSAQGAASAFGSVWQGALSVAGGLGIVTSISGIVSSLKNLAVESVQAAARMEALRAQFTALQGAAQGAVTLQNLFTTAQRLGVEFGTLANAFRRFDAATQGTAIQGAQAQRIFEQITTGMRAMGASSEATGRALQSLQQMISKGVVSQEELRQQLGDALPGAMGIAARAFGVTTQEMNKMIEKGMEATSFVQAFGNQVEREFAGKAATATNTLATAWQRFSNELEQFKGSLAGEELVSSLRDLATWAARVLETMRQARELRQERLGGAAPAIPPEMAGMRTLEARQREIEELRRTVEIGERGFAYPGEVSFFGGMPTEAQLEQTRQRLLELQKMQREAIQRIQDQWAAENEQPMTAAMLPGARTTEAIRKRYEEGLKELRAIDATAAFVTPLELAEEKAKAWHKVMQDIRQEAGRIGEGLRSTLTPTGRTTPFDEMITRLAGERGLDPNLMRALIEQESGFNPQARSRAGAMGLMQLMPATARQYGAGGREFDPEANLRAGMNYFADLLKQFNGNVERALTAYNAGPGRGGIPLPTGENATFAQDVLRRMPRGAGGYLEQGQRLEEALRLGVEAEKPDSERLAQIRATGREYLRAQEEAERLAEQELKEDRRRRRAERGDLDIFGLMLSPEQETELKQQAEEQRKRVQEFAKSLDIFGLELAPEVERQRRQSEAFDQRLEAAIALQRAPRLEQPETRLRAEAARQGLILTAAQEEQLQLLTRLRREQERLNMAVEIWRDLSQGIGSAWVSALSSIADGTRTVSEAFRAMGQSILKTMADIAAQQAFQALFRLGTGLLLGALTSSAVGTTQYASPIGPGLEGMPGGAFVPSAPSGAIPALQHGGVVRQPTLAYLGEAGTEYVVPERQMQAMHMAMRTQGTQGSVSPVSIHNYPNREAAEDGAARSRAQGEDAIVNAVTSNLSRGESSSILRAIRTLQR